MNNTTITVQQYFDGYKLHTSGPYDITVVAGYYKSIEKSTTMSPGHYNTLLPSMVEAHCHLFLNGDELDFAQRSQYMKSSKTAMTTLAMANLQKYHKYGIRVIRDAGDAFGINTAVKQYATELGIKLISAGVGIRKAKRYGSFMACEVGSIADIQQVIDGILPSADSVKVVLTGIIDFEHGKVKGKPQFSLAEMQAIVKYVHAKGLKVFVHCSGEAGLDIAVKSGVDSIEHGFFMNKRLLEEMGEQGIVWVPTFIPVAFQYYHPEYCGWTAETLARLNDILENHRKMLRQAINWGNRIMVGSDAGSYGVGHVSGLLAEITEMRQAGIADADIFKALVTTSREYFNLPVPEVKINAKADYCLLE